MRVKASKKSSISVWTVWIMSKMCSLAQKAALNSFSPANYLRRLLQFEHFISQRRSLTATIKPLWEVKPVEMSVRDQIHKLKLMWVISEHLTDVNRMCVQKWNVKMMRRKRSRHFEDFWPLQRKKTKKKTQVRFWDKATRAQCPYLSHIVLQCVWVLEVVNVSWTFCELRCVSAYQRLFGLSTFGLLRGIGQEVVSGTVQG